MLEDFAEFQVQAALKQYEDQGKGAKALRGAAENVRVHPMQHRPDEDSGSHQNDDVGHVRKAYETVGDEGENEKAPEDGKKKR
jgi:hypothetical protein